MNQLYKLYKNIEQYIVKVMFVLTIIFLSLLAITIQYLQVEGGLERLPFSQVIIDILFILWPIFFLERLLYVIICHKRKKKYVAHFLIALIPPLRLAARRCDDKEYIWWNGDWQLVDKSLSQRIDKWFLYPILLISLIMIPFWIMEIFFQTKISMHPSLYHVLNFGNALIWGLFVTEFIIMISITQKKGNYVIKHLLELFIIILPLLALSRFILITKYIKISKSTYILWFVKIQYLLNIYRTKSVINRIIRLLIIIDIVKRFYQRKNPQRYLLILKNELHEKEQEVADLKNKISETKNLINEIRQNEELKNG